MKTDCDNLYHYSDGAMVWLSIDNLNPKLLNCIPISTYRLKDYSCDKYFISCLRDAEPKRKKGADTTFKPNSAYGKKHKININKPFRPSKPCLHKNKDSKQVSKKTNSL